MTLLQSQRSNREVEIVKSYVKPSFQVIELQLKENIAAVPTTVYKHATATNTNAEVFTMALSEANIGFAVDGITIPDAGLDS